GGDALLLAEGGDMAVEEAEVGARAVLAAVYFVVGDAHHRILVPQEPRLQPLHVHRADGVADLVGPGAGKEDLLLAAANARHRTGQAVGTMLLGHAAGDGDPAGVAGHGVGGLGPPG